MLALHCSCCCLWGLAAAAGRHALRSLTELPVEHVMRREEAARAMLAGVPSGSFFGVQIDLAEGRWI